MLIYDHNKEFIGIDEDDLRLLGYASAQELLSECSDIADLFVKKPGFIHNFKNFQWIDFILHAEAETSKAIIQAKTRSFSCDITIKPFFLTNAPGQEAFAIFLQHVKPLGAADEAAMAAAPATAAPAAPAASVVPPVPPAAAPAAAAAPVTPAKPSVNEEASELPSFDDVSMTTLNEPDILDVPETPDTAEAVHDPYEETEEIFPDFNAPLDIEEDIFMSDETEPSPLQEDIFEAPVAEEPVFAEEPAFAEEAILPEERISSEEQAFIQNLQTPSDYVFDPHIAADELGLPVDLIEEFIGDFIQQSHDFHDELFEASAKSDFENVKILSHKLKGVAANLRIEDAFEVLSIINNSHDETEVEASLKRFYQIIGKLEGKEEAVPTAAAAAPAAPEAPTAPAADTEELSQAPADIEDDIYAFDLVQSEKSAEPAAEEPKTEESTDDLYNFDIMAEPASKRETPAIETSDDLYNFDIPEETATDDLQPAADSSDDLYNFDIPEEPSAEKKPSESSPADDLYNFDIAEQLPAEQSGSDENLYGTPPSEGSDTVNAPQAEEEAAGPADETPKLLHYDAEQAANELGLGVAIIQELKNDFIADARGVASDFDESITLSQSGLWQVYASRLKGVADNLRMHEISETLGTLTHTEDAKEAAKAVRQLYSYIDQL